MMVRRVADLALRSIAVLAVTGAGAVGLALPGSVLLGGFAWLAFLLAAAAGWGSLVVRVLDLPTPDAGQRCAWGIAGYLAVAGILVAAGICTRPVILALLGLGLAGFGWRELTTPTPMWRDVLAGLRFARARPSLAALSVMLAGLALAHLAGAVARLERNPWDDDLAYTPLIARVLAVGDLVEPFSFRRLGAYGGQTLLGALAGARGTLANVHLIDHGLGFAVTLLLLVGHARARRVHLAWGALLVLVLLLLPDTSINTASYWTGAMVFLALYRALTTNAWIVAGLLAAAACSLRQNYLAVAALLVIGVLAARLVTAVGEQGWRRGWAGERGACARAIGATTAGLAGWWIAAIASSGTPLFPLIGGTFNPALSLAPTALSWPQELQFLLWCAIETAPLVVIPPLFLVLALARDRRGGRPLTALFIAASIGFLLLAHGFTGSEPAHLWRYAFGPALALLIALVLDIADGGDLPPVELPVLGRWLTLAALVLQLVATREVLPRAIADLGGNLREARAIGRHGDPVAVSERRRYAALQAALPVGARVAVMVDDPSYLDYARNDLVNLDTPGYASPAPGLPAFEGPDAWRAYFLGQRVRYIAFVRSDASHHFFRRPFWGWRVFHDSELFQAMSAYTLDAIDTLETLATTTTVLHDADGLVLLDLGASPASRLTRERVVDDEVSRRHAFVRTFAEREGHLDAWSLSPRAEVIFDDGWSGVVTVDEQQPADPQWFEVIPARAPEPHAGTPARWMNRRTHVRLRAGVGPMRLRIHGRINRVATHARPRLDAALDGTLAGSVVVADDGGFSLDVKVRADLLGARGSWHDLYLVWTTAVDPEATSRDVRVARLHELTWEPAL